MEGTIEMKNTQNVGTLERWLRIIGGAAVAIIGLILFLPTPASLLLGITGIALVLLGLDFVVIGHWLLFTLPTPGLEHQGAEVIARCERVRAIYPYPSI